MTKTLRRLLILILTITIASAAVVVRGPSVLTMLGVTRNQTTKTIPAYANTPVRLDIGATTPSLARNEWREWTNLDEIDQFESQLRRRIPVVMWYADWRQEINAAQLDLVRKHSSTPEITWEPWDHATGRDGNRYSLQDIALGKFDGYISRWGASLQRYQVPVKIRFAHEMNGGWYPWSCNSHQNSPDDYISAWRHVHDIFLREGATNVQWIWSPITGQIKSDCYPGAAYVDVVSVSGFNGEGSHYRTYDETFRDPINAIKAIAPGKQVAISEVSAPPNDRRPGWVRDVVRKAEAQGVTEIVWFDSDSASGVGWRISDDPASMQALRETINAG